MSEDFRETLCTVDSRGNRKWVYTAVVKGKFYRARKIIAYILMAIYLILPWVPVGGKQAVFLDFINQRFVFFGVEFWATEMHYLFFLLGISAFSLFFFTAFFGRIWCGWACPETVFLEFLFRPIERLIEGSPTQRKRLDAQPWNFHKVWKKILKHFFSAAAAWILASTTLAYFIGRGPLLQMMSDWPQQNLVPFSATVVLMGLLGFQFGWFREQFCSILCPYARFQSVLMDSQSLVVGYDIVRGEPRGKLSKNKAGNRLGDCVDCGLCVRVCPTGIDIRNGLQLECIACTACIDACDSVMSKIERPQGLIRYDTEDGLLKGEKTRALLRPRPLLYGGLLLVFIALFVYALSSRRLTEFQVLRGALDQPYMHLADGRISNHFHVRVANKGSAPTSYTFRAEGAEEIDLITPLSPFTVRGGKLQTVPLFVNFSNSLLKGGKKKLLIILESKQGYSDAEQVTLLGPDK